MRNMLGAIAASAFISCMIVLPGSFVSSAQSEQAPVSTPLPAPAAADSFDPEVCGAQGWPYYNKDCARGGDAVRIIKIGQGATARR